MIRLYYNDGGISSFREYISTPLDTRFTCYKEVDKKSRYYSYWFLVHLPTGYTVGCTEKKPTKKDIKIFDSFSWSLENAKLVGISEKGTKVSITSYRNHLVEV